MSPTSHHVTPRVSREGTNSPSPHNYQLNLGSCIKIHPLFTDKIRVLIERAVNRIAGRIDCCGVHCGKINCKLVHRVSSPGVGNPSRYSPTTQNRVAPNTAIYSPNHTHTVPYTLFVSLTSLTSDNPVMTYIKGWVGRSRMEWGLFVGGREPHAGKHNITILYRVQARHRYR